MSKIATMALLNPCMEFQKIFSKLFLLRPFVRFLPKILQYVLITLSNLTFYIQKMPNWHFLKKPSRGLNFLIEHTFYYPIRTIWKRNWEWLFPFGYISDFEWCVVSDCPEVLKEPRDRKYYPLAP